MRRAVALGALLLVATLCVPLAAADRRELCVDTPPRQTCDEVRDLLATRPTIPDPRPPSVPRLPPVPQPPAPPTVPIGPAALVELVSDAIERAPAPGSACASVPERIALNVDFVGDRLRGLGQGWLAGHFEREWARASQPRDRCEELAAR